MANASLLVQGSPYNSSLQQIRDNLTSRQIRHGFSLLGKLDGEFESCDPQQPGAGVLVGYLAQWVDIGYGRRDLVRRLLERFPNSCRQGLAVLYYANLLMAEGLVMMSEEDYGRAAEQFAVVLALQGDLQDKQVISIAYFWTGRCLRRHGRYDDALGYVAKARELALELSYPKMAAVMRVLEGWIAFQEGRPEDASA